jgi:hypothetical protein
VAEIRFSALGGVLKAPRNIDVLFLHSAALLIGGSALNRRGTVSLRCRWHVMMQHTLEPRLASPAEMRAPPMLLC